MDVTGGQVPRRHATNQKAKVERVGDVTSVERQIPTVDVAEIRDQAKSFNQKMQSNTPELQEILDVLNIIRHKGNIMIKYLINLINILFRSNLHQAGVKRKWRN